MKLFKYFTIECRETQLSGESLGLNKKISFYEALPETNSEY